MQSTVRYIKFCLENHLHFATELCCWGIVRAILLSLLMEHCLLLSLVLTLKLLYANSKHNVEEKFPYTMNSHYKGLDIVTSEQETQS